MHTTNTENGSRMLQLMFLLLNKLCFFYKQFADCHAQKRNRLIHVCKSSSFVPFQLKTAYYVKYTRISVDYSM